MDVDATCNQWGYGQGKVASEEKKKRKEKRRGKKRRPGREREKGKSSGPFLYNFTIDRTHTSGQLKWTGVKKRRSSRLNELGGAEIEYGGCACEWRVCLISNKNHFHCDDAEGRECNLGLMFNPSSQQAGWLLLCARIELQLNTSERGKEDRRRVAKEGAFTLALDYFFCFALLLLCCSNVVYSLCRPVFVFQPQTTSQKKSSCCTNGKDRDAIHIREAICHPLVVTAAVLTLSGPAFPSFLVHYRQETT